MEYNRKAYCTFLHLRDGMEQALAVYHGKDRFDDLVSSVREAAALLGFDLVPRKSSEASRADHEYRVLNGCEPPVTEATDKFDGRNSSRVDQPIIHHQV